ncbi:TRAP transporter large permease subunit [Cribrihabitans neustonicus]|uniref:TRAP transporter large permease subunit n=1 Tax=Cribrihabitans neustonicus TaxID=1429085 RepID=UPI003B5C51E0
MTGSNWGAFEELHFRLSLSCGWRKSCWPSGSAIRWAVSCCRRCPLPARAGVTERVIRYADARVGQNRGCIAQVNVFVTMLFAGRAGSSTEDTAGLYARPRTYILFSLT